MALIECTSCAQIFEVNKEDLDLFIVSHQTGKHARITSRTPVFKVYPNSSDVPSSKKVLEAMAVRWQREDSCQV